MRAVIVVGLVTWAACYRGGPEPAPITPAQPAARAPTPDVRFAIADDVTVRILHLHPDGEIIIERTAMVTGTVDVLLWNGADPVVWIQRDIPWHGRPYDDAAHENDMGVVAASGFLAFAPLTWPETPKPTGEMSDLASKASWNTLIAAPHGEIYQGHCSWYGGPDGGWCQKFTFARRVPADGPFTDTEPEVDDHTFKLPKIAAGKHLEAKVAKHVAPGEDDGGEDRWDTPHTLHCADRGGRTVEWPDREALLAADPDHAPPEIQNTTIFWISTEPPIYQIDLAFSAGVGPVPEPYYKVFEGCAPSARYATAFGGPDDLAVVVGKELAVMWHGREIAHAKIAAQLVAFAPATDTPRP